MPSQLNVPAAAHLEQIFNAVNLGLIMVDADERILLWNSWLARHSGLPQEQVIGKKLAEAFDTPPTAAFLTAVRNTLSHGLPVILSNALHRSPLPLFDPAELSEEKVRMHQTISITPLSSPDGNRCCLIQVTDSSTSIKREKMLRSHSEILKVEATTDSLTGIYNRRFFDEHYKMALGHSKREKLPLSVFMIDIDFFKEYNDYYGHLAGDKTIIAVANTLKAQLFRSTDVLARYGGEEFILMLPNTPEESALQFAEKLRLAIWNLGIPHLKSKIAQQLSISIGLSTFHQENDGDLKILLKCADAALYKAKQKGRNQCVQMPVSELTALSTVS
ncbi:diguanylate cyclase [Undibacterium sp.]|uniref:sensor domain-containing diguanylate cyclase n=1 Tax=Undibacterium sp. TaxID=1914977 RepID=UPI002C790E5A|nr:diguanylate cyclase [Undibacterium sp.]HTD03076.1 diguanylate cyclase [Undibacterium sp.]